MNRSLLPRINRLTLNNFGNIILRLKARKSNAFESLQEYEYLSSYWPQSFKNTLCLEKSLKLLDFKENPEIS